MAGVEASRLKIVRQVIDLVTFILQPLVNVQMRAHYAIEKGKKRALVLFFDTRNYIRHRLPSWRRIISTARERGTGLRMKGRFS